MELTVLGGSGLWPRAGQACSGYLLTHDDIRLLIDPGHGVLVELLRHCNATDIDAVLISQGRPDHCADLGALLRARVLGDDAPSALPVVAPENSLDALLALDPAVPSDAVDQIRPPGSKINFGPFAVEAVALSADRSRFGFRITDPAGAVFVYAGESADDAARVRLAHEAGLLVVEATYPDAIPASQARDHSDARQIGDLALEADVDHCVITHLHPTADPILALSLIRRTGFDAVEYALPGLVREVLPRPAATGLPRRAAPKVITMTASAPRRAASQ
ncbi:MBL fold metallo-hydrolase [Microlunatus soli]|uniref:Ribonuclease BN, tRNA processing enzyme n=1 Tax=Microlunatus soli TaxID=630515 RepID=A0A1H1PZQ9_9ACTN|nr:MBL fold metallo-hydrolase [Microlunatus soli]SDS16603.1 Ribonuclease BN, tRNA processing enzyme [Microlunatus soli]